MVARASIQGGTERRRNLRDRAISNISCDFLQIFFKDEEEKEEEEARVIQPENPSVHARIRWKNRGVRRGGKN